MSNPTFNSAHDEAYNVPKEARPHLYHSIKSCGPGDLHVVANATTFTLLTPDGAVYTYGDPRYPRCLGRPPNHNSSNPSGFEEIEYLSHTPCRKIASAGWMTGALSNDGELFIWGQSEPGVDKAIAALNPSSANGEEEEDEADEFVKVVKVTVDGADATVTDFGIGTGHLVVVARVEEDGEVVKRAVLACGQGESGQLGIGGRPEFVGNLMEIEALRDMDVTGVMCGGRSSFLAVNLMR
ncbi:hypothetical protein K432DRAFT_308384 [Lepidopterella palustris CBS 459.81]|uniref:RCC1/BLIP-II n=1 Tax=Lepidopterella palustris CBS 459.81 TaxID=1314670 RepID=A0A8E2E182_9PEZI|nr:hypothetical protein K432DRAFT_308384 [Lepidopterella palustris CBS 459.81]